METKTPSQTTVCFEHPLNESIRICLRIESLFNELKEQLNHAEDQCTQALITLLKVINVLDRPDIKSKLSQTLNSYASSLSQLQRFPQVDQQRLQKVLHQLDTLSTQFHRDQNIVANRLKSHHFLNHLRLQLTNPAGICQYSCSQLKLWQKQAFSTKKDYINSWMTQIKDIDACAELLLGIVRHSAVKKDAVAQHGFYQKTLSPSLPCDLIRISIEKHSPAYPEICAGRHRLSVRFMQPCFTEEHPKQSTEDIAFQLSCCRL